MFKRYFKLRRITFSIKNPCSLCRNSYHVRIGMNWRSPLHTRHHMGGDATDPGIWRQGPHSSPGSSQAPYKCSKNISHNGTDHTPPVSNNVFKSIPSIAYSKLSLSTFTRRYLLPVMSEGSNCTLAKTSPTGNVLRDAVSFRGIKSNPGKTKRHTTCLVMFTE